VKRSGRPSGWGQARPLDVVKTLKGDVSGDATCPKVCIEIRAGGGTLDACERSASTHDMAIPAFRFTFERDWLTAPLAIWVHVPVGGQAGAWSPPAPQPLANKGFPVLRVAFQRHELVFSSPAQVAHMVDVLASTPLPTSLQLSARRGIPMGPNGHWLSRLPAELKSPKLREKLVKHLRDVYARVVLANENSFAIPDETAFKSLKERTR